MLRPRKTIFAGVMAGLTLLLAAVPALAQEAGKPETFKPQVTGVPGSPSATTTISGKQLPAPGPKFGGVITEGYAQSKSWWPPAWFRPRARQTCC
jgi:hypothetical protein